MLISTIDMQNLIRITILFGTAIRLKFPLHFDDILLHKFISNRVDKHDGLVYRYVRIMATVQTQSVFITEIICR